MAHDPHSLSNPEKVSIRHIEFDLAVDFNNKSITGCVSLYLNPYDFNEIIIDTDGLHIHKVMVGLARISAEFRLGDEVEHLGRPLSITLPANCPVVHIEYTTSSHSKALQWLTPSQTSDGRHPFLFTQSETIFARTWIPCQDTPSVRTTYHALVKVPEGLMAVMSAQNPTRRNSSNVYEFKANAPIPSYLFALAVGDIEFHAISPRAGVYAERTILSEAAFEFANIESMIQVAESLYGPYRWGRFDLIVLPPSFPFGGMENPQLVFVTPSLLAGDRSLTSLLAHELAHSWSGNLVTNATWNDFWLNEGFSVYSEHRIVEELYGKAYEEMLSLLSLESLNSEMAALSPRDTWLQLDLVGRHPNDCITEVPYEKGFLFLRMLEQGLGRERWDKFFKQYFDSFSFQSVDTCQFLEFLRNHAFNNDEEIEKSLHIESWIYGPGLPKNCPTIKSTEFERVDVQVKLFQNGVHATELDTRSWTPHHWIYFLRNLIRPLGENEIVSLDETFHLTDSRNAEILFQWFLLCICSDYWSVEYALEAFLVRQGRLKFVKPLYSELIKSSSGREKAVRIYGIARSNYHPVVVDIIDDILL